MEKSQRSLDVAQDDKKGARDDKGDFSTHFKLAAKIVNLVWILLLFDK